MKKFSFIVLASLLLSLNGCDSDNERANIPFVYVNERVNVESIVNKDLWRSGGHVTLNAGYRGIIIVNEGGDNFHAFERACTFDAEKECAIVEMDDSELYLIDHCCNSSFDFAGNPIGGPATIPLLEYTTYREGDFLVIVNE